VRPVDGKLAGVSVNIGARVAAQAGEGEVLVSGTVKDLVAGSGIEFEPRGVRELKGLGDWPLYAVVAAQTNKEGALPEGLQRPLGSGAQKLPPRCAVRPPATSRLVR
jgi:class 3 adenylate cyclase